MAINVSLVNYTEQGIRNIKDSPQRARAFRELCKQQGVQVREILWTTGLLVATIVPTDPVGQALSTAGYVHRYASAAAFAALLGAGVLLGRNSRWLTALGGLGGVAMLASTYLFDRVAIGLTERVLAAAGLGVLIEVALRQVMPRAA